MVTKEITLCGKQVTLAYCYATEIGYKILEGEEVSEFFKHVAQSFKDAKDPDTQKTLHAIQAFMVAFYEKPKYLPLTDRDMLRDLMPSEFAEAIMTMGQLREEFYFIPKDEPKEKQDGGNEKNA